MDKKRLLIYGIGQRFYSERFYNFILPEIILSSQEVFVCDKDNNKSQKVGLPFFERSEGIVEFDEIVITSDRYFTEIKDELVKEYQVNENKCLTIEDVEAAILREMFKAELFSGLSGVEVGGPSNIFKSSIYANMKSCDGINFSKETVWWKDGGQGYVIDNEVKGEIIIGDIVSVGQIENEKYDFCISSNNLEHIANPIKALLEMKRIVKKEGLILIIVPNKDNCFDHNRSVTSFAHLFSDYANKIDETDMTHLDEILGKHDYAMDVGVSSKEEFFERAQKNYENRCLHHHVFDEDLLESLFKFIGVERLASGKIHNNWYALGRKHE